MRRPIAATALTVALLTTGTTTVALGQNASPQRTKLFGRSPADAFAPKEAPKSDAMVVPANRVPDLVPADQLGEVKTVLPTEPIEPYLLTKENGPFMVLAHTFRGPNADKYAQALAMELRRDYGLKAYVCRIRDIPMHSNVFGIPPTAPSGVSQPNVQFPEKVRTTDEAGVFVGDCKTIDESGKLWHQVKKIKPVSVDGVPTMFGWRKGQGLSRALKTTNPFVPAQVLFPKKADPMIKQINGGPHSIFGCTGNYTLQVADFSGRVRMDDGSVRAQSFMTANLKESPLASAAADAEKLAEGLARDKDVQQTGYKPYVYHDRFSSKVTMGSFNSPDDPNIPKLKQRLLELSGPLNSRKATDVYIVPGELMKNPSLGNQ